MKRAKKKFKPAKLKPVDNQSQPSIPEDLSQKWGAVEAVATTFNCLQQGSFTHAYMRALTASLGFLQELHKQTVADALKHPQADLIPELKAMKLKAEKDGTTEAQQVS